MMQGKKAQGRTALCALLILAIALGLFSFSFQNPEPASAASGTITFNGHGKGHGVGMCMSGVYFRAQRGEKYQTIIPYYYRGVSFGKMDDNTLIRVLCRDNQVRIYTFRDYLYRQMEEPDSWPQEGLKVLAIAMRTYAIATKNSGKHAAQGYDICSSGSCCQAFDETIDPAKRPNIVAAVNATAGIIITYNDAPIVAAYSSCCGGYTASATEVWGGQGYPYWQPVPDDACAASKDHDWSVTMSWGDLEAKLNSNASTAVGALYGITILANGPSGRVTKMGIQGAAGTKQVTGYLFASVVGLQTDFFTIVQPNFDEYILLGNPSDSQQANVHITYTMPSGQMSGDYVVPPRSRYTVYVDSFLQNTEVSAKVESNIPILAERSMYFNYRGNWTGGSDAAGTTSPANTWYFAEGYTGTGFEEWVCVLNPGDNQANMTFRFQTQEEGEKVVGNLSVPPHSRRTFSVNNLLGKAYQTSLKLESDQQVIAERPMYFDYLGTAAHHWTGGHDVMGINSLSKQYYLAEGTTRTGFEEWLTLQNPNAGDITVNATYQLGPGQGAPIDKSYVVPANSRRTVYVPNEVGRDKDVSVLVSSSDDFLAERPMYFDYTFGGGHWTGGHCVIGSPQTSNDWLFAEGYTGEGFNQWLCLQNPGDQDSTVSITYYTQEAGALADRAETIPARSRKTIMVNQHAGANYQLSTEVKVTAGPGIVAERPMYFNYMHSRDGGSDSLGIITPSKLWYFAEGYTGQ
jgi:SpoIID/LytB domain protein